MSMPRRLLPYATYLITRRCTQRMCLLRPDEHTAKVVNYCLAEAAKRYKIDLIAWLMMSNHYHAVVHDPDCVLPAFLAHFHKMVAKALNHRWDRRENFWSSGETCVTLLPTQEDVLAKVVYVLTNPVKAHLFDSVEQWPGASSWRYLNSQPKRHARPDGYFKQTKKKGTKNQTKDRMAESADLRAVPPPAMNGEKALSVGAWAKRVRAAVAEKEASLRVVRRREKIRLVGISANLKPTDSPSTKEARGKLQPAVACHDKALRKIELANLKAFRAEYQRVRALYSGGSRRVYFPAGTYRMRILGAPCRPFDEVQRRSGPRSLFKRPAIDRSHQLKPLTNSTGAMRRAG